MIEGQRRATGYWFSERTIHRIRKTGLNSISRMPLLRESYIKALRSEYVVTEEAARLLAEIEGVLPDAMCMALCVLSTSDKDGIPNEEFKKEARAAVIRELLEYLQTELNPLPPHPGPQLVPAKKRRPRRKAE